MSRGVRAVRPASRRIVPSWPVATARAVMQYFTAFGSQVQRLREQCGTVSAIAGILKSPFDIIADKFRGYIGHVHWKDLPKEMEASRGRRTRNPPTNQQSSRPLLSCVFEHARADKPPMAPGLLLITQLLDDRHDLFVGHEASTMP